MKAWVFIYLFTAFGILLVSVKDSPDASRNTQAAPVVSVADACVLEAAGDILAAAICEEASVMSAGMVPENTAHDKNDYSSKLLKLKSGGMGTVFTGTITSYECSRKFYFPATYTLSQLRRFNI